MSETPPAKQEWTNCGRRMDRAAWVAHRIIVKHKSSQISLDATRGLVTVNGLAITYGSIPERSPMQK